MIESLTGEPAFRELMRDTPASPEAARRLIAGLVDLGHAALDEVRDGLANTAATDGRSAVWELRKITKRLDDLYGICWAAESPNAHQTILDCLGKSVLGYVMASDLPGRVHAADARITPGDYALALLDLVHKGTVKHTRRGRSVSVYALA